MAYELRGLHNRHNLRLSEQQQTPRALNPLVLACMLLSTLPRRAPTVNNRR